MDRLSKQARMQLSHRRCPAVPGMKNFNRCSLCGVRSLSICGALGQADLEEFERIGRHVHLASNQALFTRGPGRRFRLQSDSRGCPSLQAFADDGGRFWVFALPGDFIGTTFSDYYNFSADAIEAVSACRFPVDAFSQFTEHRPELLRRINESAARELMLAQDQMLLLGRRTAEEKVAAFLIGWRDRLARIDDGRQSILLPMMSSGHRGFPGADDRNGQPDIDPVRAGKRCSLS